MPKNIVKMLIMTIILCLICQVSFAGTKTVHYLLYKPSIAETDWGQAMNGNLNTIDALIWGLDTNLSRILWEVLNTPTPTRTPTSTHTPSVTPTSTFTATMTSVPTSTYTPTQTPTGGFAEYLRSDVDDIGNGNYVFDKNIAVTFKLLIGFSYWPFRSGDALLHVYGGDAGGFSPSPETFFLIENSAGCFMNLFGGASNIVGINFGDEGNPEVGGLLYDNADNEWEIKGNNKVRMSIPSAGYIHIGPTCTPVSATGWGDLLVDDTLEVQGTADLRGADTMIKPINASPLPSGHCVNGTIQIYYEGGGITRLYWCADTNWAYIQIDADSNAVTGKWGE